MLIRPHHIHEVTFRQSDRVVARLALVGAVAAGIGLAQHTSVDIDQRYVLHCRIRGLLESERRVRTGNDEVADASSDGAVRRCDGDGVIGAWAK